MKGFIKNFFLSTRFFIALGIIIAVFALGFAFPVLIPAGQSLIILLTALLLTDIVLLWNKNSQIEGVRSVPRLLSLGSTNKIRLRIKNMHSVKLFLRVIDELPFQMQKRDFSVILSAEPQKEKDLSYEINPKERGLYGFGNINIIARTIIGLAERRFILPQEKKVPVYPSVIQMKNFELRAFDKISFYQGIKKIRKLGQSYEFDQIKNYVQGDNVQNINWKATGRQSELMVNTYELERSQQIYSIIDKGRTMRMPFQGLRLIDHAINTSLVISNIALKKEDKAGLITFSNQKGSVIKADKSKVQLKKILETLYNEQEKQAESNYELLYTLTKRVVTTRSLLFLFTNFESLYALERVLPVLRKLNKTHLVVVIFFSNTEIEEYVEKQAKDVRDIYYQTIARKFAAEKQQIVQELRKYGIQAILSSPEELSVNTVNKYLELKSRGLI